MTHAESIMLIDSYGLDFSLECKTLSMKLPYEGYTQAQFAQDIIDEYKEAGIHYSRVWPQSFLIDDIYYWIKAEPDFAKRTIFLDELVDTPEGYINATARFPQLRKMAFRSSSRLSLP
jgi:glycerophosphoryl diester phosphodiesterase